jgi:DNA replicative helicase MCM subunit Mcm2 (Cdc46/Mcm family)
LQEEERMTKHIQVRPFGLLDVTNLRQLNPEDINTLVAMRGMVIQVFPCTPDMEAGVSSIELPVFIF